MKLKKKRYEIITAVIAALIAVSMLSAASADETKATVTDAWIPFDVWRGAGDTSATLKLSPDFDLLMKADEFVSLETGGAELDKAYYIVTSDADGRTVVTLKEEYLKTLKNGKAFYFHAEFEKARIGLRLFVVTEKATITKDLIFMSGVDGPWDGKTMPEEPWDGKSDLSVVITGNDDFSFGPEIFQKLVFDTEVDPSNYIVRGFGDTVSVNLKAEYARRFGPGIFGFIAVFDNADVTLNFDTSYTYMPGDINGDAAVTAEDARLALRAAAKLETLTGDALSAADLSGTGEITATEARQILRVAAKLEYFVKLYGDDTRIPIDDYILVCMEHEYSFPEKDYEPSYFGEEYVEKVEAIFVYNEGSLADKDNFCRVEKLYLTELGKEHIHELIKNLTDREDILAAEQDYYCYNALGDGAQ